MEFNFEMGAAYFNQMRTVGNSMGRSASELGLIGLRAHIHRMWSAQSARTLGRCKPVRVQCGEQPDVGREAAACDIARAVVEGRATIAKDT